MYSIAYFSQHFRDKWIKRKVGKRTSQTKGKLVGKYINMGS